VIISEYLDVSHSLIFKKIIDVRIKNIIDIKTLALFR
jgi:hypothetical protein